MDPPSAVSNWDTTALGRPSSVIQRLRTALLALSFWAAIVLPAIYLPLFAVGPEPVTRGVVIAAVLGVHVLTLITSHSYVPE